MANFCNFVLKVVGPEAGVQAFTKVIQTKDQTKGKHLSRVTDVDIVKRKDGMCIFAGLCAWSTYVCMLEGDNTYHKRNLESDNPDPNVTSLNALTSEFGVEVELYSEETGIGFQEHILITPLAVTINECVDYEEHDPTDFDTLEEMNQCFETDYSQEQFDDEEVMHVGGFEKWKFQI